MVDQADLVVVSAGTIGGWASVFAKADGVRRVVVVGVTVASAGGHGMMWGPGVARVAADLVVRGRTELIDVGDLGLDRFDADGRSRLAGDPIALPFPISAE